MESRVEKRLERAIEVAKERIDTENAKSPELRFALEIVERFLKKKRRVCYGGTAINAQLPEKLQFYSLEKDLPDYDFFTPDIDADVQEIVETLKRAGFDDVAHRVGMHEGTKKIMVNYVPVADISEMDRSIYDVLERRAVVVKGILYTDPDVLRMMMYLELSRPKGEVERWKKVYERLMLINRVFPMRKCSKEQRRPHQIPVEVREKIHAFCIDNKRILAGSRLENIYHKSISSDKPISWETREGGAVVFYSPNPKEDALTLRSIMGAGRETDIRAYEAKGELVPPRVVLMLDRRPVALIIMEVACHGYNTLKTEDRQTVYIASLDTLITLYLSLAIFTEDEKSIFGFSLLCAAERFIAVNNTIQKSGRKQFHPFPLECRGYQKGYPTLLREKVHRIAEEKLKLLLKDGPTKKEKKKGKNVTRKR